MVYGWGIWQSKYSLQIHNMFSVSWLESVWVWPKSSPFTFWLSIEFKCVLFSGTNSLYLFFMNKDHHSVSSTLEILSMCFTNICRRSMRINLYNQSLAKKLRSECYVLSIIFEGGAIIFFVRWTNTTKKYPIIPQPKNYFPNPWSNYSWMSYLSRS